MNNQAKELLRIRRQIYAGMQRSGQKRTVHTYDDGTFGVFIMFEGCEPDEKDRQQLQVFKGLYSFDLTEPYKDMKGVTCIGLSRPYDSANPVIWSDK